jgi:hypothetical protein
MVISGNREFGGMAFPPLFLVLVALTVFPSTLWGVESETDFPAGDDQVEDISRFVPSFGVELTTVEVVGDSAFVYGVGGVTVLDISNPEDAVMRGHYQPPGHPDVRFYDGEYFDKVAYGGGREDLLFVVDFTLSFDPRLEKIHGTPGMIYEGIARRDDHLYASRHADGLEILDLADPLNPQTVGELTDLQNSWDVAFVADYILVADGGGGLAVVDGSDVTAPVLIQRLPTSGAAVDVDVAGGLAAVAVGSGGVDLFDVTDPEAVVPLGTVDTPGLAMAVALTADLLYVADYHTIEVFDVSVPTSPMAAGWEDTPIRAMGLDARDDLAVVADWSSVRFYRQGPSSRGDIHVAVSSIAFGPVAAGTVADTTFVIANTGGAPVQVDEIVEFGEAFSLSEPTSFSLDPGMNAEITLTYAPVVEGYDATFLRIGSDDSDEGVITFPVTADDQPWVLEVGDEAPDFTLADMDGVLHSLSDYRGQVVVAAFFANW